VPDLDLLPYAESQRRSRVRRLAAVRARRRRWSLRSALLVLVACLSLTAGGALASSRGHRLPRATVVAAQQALGVTADGIIGPQTRRAIRRFQRRHGLRVTGRLNPRTLAALGVTSTARTDSVAPGDVKAELAKIAQCESGGDPTAVSADGRYRGKYQFTRDTWRRLGGKGDPAAAPEWQQDKLAAKLLAADGTAPWPNCA
jgi:peptidoglycan hydrolase-like protein with peptidoglycan-binding domain